MAEDITWEDPPPQVSPWGQWPGRLRPLVDDPKRWARMQHYPGKGSGGGAYQIAKRIRQEKYIPGMWETAVRRTDPNDETKGYDLYVRYMGDGDA